MWVVRPRAAAHIMLVRPLAERAAQTWRAAQCWQRVIVGKAVAHRAFLWLVWCGQLGSSCPKNLGTRAFGYRLQVEGSV